MSNLPPVSIGISFYNAEKTLLNAIRSVFAQTHKNWELILIDDGSIDNSLNLALSINDPRVRVFSDGENRRLAARLNQIADLAKYDYVARMDADDLMSSRRIEKQLKFMLENPHLDLVSTGVCSLSVDDEPVGMRLAKRDHQITPKGLLHGQSGIVHASLLARRNWFIRNRYKECMLKSQDTNLWVRAFSRGDLNIGFLPEDLYYYREDGNVTRQGMLLAYKMGRQTILKDAKYKFGVLDKMSGLALNLFKTLALMAFPQVMLKVARNRRNSQEVSATRKAAIKKEIVDIKALSLPGYQGEGG